MKLIPYLMTSFTLVLALPLISYAMNVREATVHEFNVENVTPKGEYAKINLHNDSYIQETLRNSLSTKDEIKDAIAKVKAHPGDFTPPVLMMMGDRMVRDGNTKEGIFWFNAGRLRGIYDMNRCADKTVGGAMQMLSMAMATTVKAQYRDPDQLKTIIQKVIKWDEKTPYNYDQRWINLHSAHFYAVSLGADKSGDNAPMSLPEDQWPAMHKKAVDMLVDAVNKSIKQISDAGGLPADK
jgi:hypothetical protein